LAAIRVELSEQAEAFPTDRCRLRIAEVMEEKELTISRQVASAADEEEDLARGSLC